MIKAVIKLGTASCACLALFLGPAKAQQPTSKPATTEDLYTYSWMAAVNTCVLASEDVDFLKAYRSSVVSVMTLLSQKHKSQINEGNTSKVITLKPEQVESGASVQVFNLIGSVCGSKLTGNNKTEYEKIKASIEKAMSNNK